MMAAIENPKPGRQAERRGWLAAGLSFALGLAPLLGLFFGVLRARPAYQFFPLALVAAGLLGWRAWREWDAPLAPGARRGTHLLAGVTALVFVLGNVLWSPWLGMLALLLLLVTLAWSLGGGRLLKAFLPALLMLASIIPPPLGWDQALTLGLRSVAVVTSDGLLDLLGVVHVLEGNTILLPGQALLVEEACSGINSVVLCGAVGLFWTLWQRRRLAWLLVLLPVTGSFVVLGNIFRITGGAALNYHWQVDWLSGRAHEVFGLVLLAVYCGLILSLDQLLVFLFLPAHQIESAKKEKVVSPAGGAPVMGIKPDAAGLRRFKLAGGLFAVTGLGILAARLVFGGGAAGLVLPRAVAARDVRLSLPASVAGWQRLDANAGQMKLAETLGVRSIVWRFHRGGAEAVVAVDYPLEGFHDVKSCYVNNGWRVLAEGKIPAGESREDRHGFQLVLERSLRRAEVFHSVVDERGQWLAPPEKKGVLRDRLFGAGPVAYPTGYRIQVLVGGYGPLSATVEGDTRELFFQVRQLLVQQLVGQFSKTGGQ